MNTINSILIPNDIDIELLCSIRTDSVSNMLKTKKISQFISMSKNRFILSIECFSHKLNSVLKELNLFSTETIINQIITYFLNENKTIYILDYTTVRFLSRFNCFKNVKKNLNEIIDFSNKEIIDKFDGKNLIFWI